MNRIEYITAVTLLTLVLSLGVIFPAEAVFCRKQGDRLICILSIERSAKYHWEYKATVSINGVSRPIEKYNCRQRVRVEKNGTAVPFEPNGAGELICSVLNKQIKS
jgi:hypothetical protein